MRIASSAVALGFLLTAAFPFRAAAECAMTSYNQCASNPARKEECVAILYAIREHCNGQADNAQAKMQELGSTTSKLAKPEMNSYMVALNTLFEISRTAQQLSYNDPKALELLKLTSLFSCRAHGWL